MQIKFSEGFSPLYERVFSSSSSIVWYGMKTRYALRYIACNECLLDGNGHGTRLVLRAFYYILHWKETDVNAFNVL